ncbi:AMIN-like domain-containing (lipo)protein, partial [Streptomyces xanthophaeus]
LHHVAGQDARGVGIALTGDYEGYVTFGAAFDTKPYYSTTVLHSPERLVLDVSHPNTC